MIQKSQCHRLSYNCNPWYTGNTITILNKDKSEFLYHLPLIPRAQIIPKNKYLHRPLAI